jgi:uncharacterized membrane protein
MKLKLALLFTLIAIGIHIYLGMHHYALQFGAVESEAICNVSAKFDCDSVAASPFSVLFGIPIALWGAAANMILALLLIGWIIGWVSE